MRKEEEKKKRKNEEEKKKRKKVRRRKGQKSPKMRREKKNHMSVSGFRKCLSCLVIICLSFILFFLDIVVAAPRIINHPISPPPPLPCRSQFFFQSLTTLFLV
jgi:hypothetical protein